MQAVIFLALFLSGRVLADCAILESKPVERVYVLDTWKARHVNEGILNGCLLKLKIENGAEQYAYTSYGFICALGKKDAIEVEKLWACCDTGDQGDFACGVKPVNPLASMPQTSLTIRPAKPDRRGIPDLMKSLESARFGARGICDRLWEYDQKPELAGDIAALVPRMRKMMENATDRDKQAAIADLLMKLAPAKSAADEVDLSLRVLQSAMYKLEPPERNALRVVAKHPELAPKIAPVLVERVYRLGAEDRPELLKVLASFQSALQPYLLRLHYILRENLADTQWKDLVCGAFPSKDPQRIVWGRDAKITSVECGPSETRE